ncbi:cytidylate kinase-like family protein [Desulfuromonas acetoxidans]|uniref:Transport-associated n=1 Tax=Desulfuromonas acetoxidans (strain DSM 684 / 11070) TaxID=281689 RepID=Q1K191_DESA6|nr:cytidylate kinase-like family protein [Desulfuromonas acetoxidans]EAT16117.1 transport-associated [Desulfuromonas acetoxidans DSM 684]MBF0646423.1 cytidylate kinase family protein [Desulfuromonas acetoxidans]NVD25530.1 cytidylate kinase family protein [Desulfuromonas acetoxidans]NVE17520.1 cytidylate kinase family protein [Desulfuromonas acetoxidans]
MAIITISREMGSGGSIIARNLADKLGYDLIDGEAILKVAASYGLTADNVEMADEKPPAFVESLDESLEIDMHRIEQIILEYALKGNAIIYGRGGQDLLAGINTVFRTRIIAPFDIRVERWAEREWLDPDLSRILVRKSDQQRAGFIKYYFDRDWNDPYDYDLVINTTKISEEMAVDLICKGIEEKNLQENNERCRQKLIDLIQCKKTEIAILQSDQVDGYHLQVHVDGGVTVLDGHVHSEDERRAIHAIVKDLAPKQELKDQLKVFAYHINPKEG